VRAQIAVLLAVIAAAPVAASLSAGGGWNRAPIRAAFFDALPAGDLPQQIAEMRYGGISAGIAGWTGPGSASDRRVPGLLRAARGRSFRWALELTGPRSQARLASELTYISGRYGRDPAYLRVDGRFVVFVADPGRGCRASARVLDANGAGAYVMLESFPGDRACARQPSGWYEDPPATGLVAHLPASATISPGPMATRDGDAGLRQSLVRWAAAVRRMTALRPRFELIASYNEAADVVENRQAWASESGHGAFLDVLHSDGVLIPGMTPAASASAPPAAVPPPAPTVQALLAPPVPAPASPAQTHAPPPVVPAHAPVPHAPPVTPPPPPPAAPDPVVAAAGDIACDPSDGNFMGGLGSPVACHMMATSDLILGLPNLAAVLALGDTQYDSGALPAFMGSFDPTWGRLKPLIHPALGNHEVQTTNADGYFQYFGAAAGPPLEGWYSYDIGAWHLIVLNANCPGTGGCGLGSPQEQWLQADLAAHQNLCTLAYWHQPRFSSGQHGDDTATDALWQDLYAAGAEIVLNGHDHDYERFAPQTPTGAADPVGGIREFVVGTGGKDHSGQGTLQPNSEVMNVDTFGVLVLTLHPAGYDWQFLPEPGMTFTDSGSGTCHGPNGPLPVEPPAPPPVVPPPVPPPAAAPPGLA